MGPSIVAARANIANHDGATAQFAVPKPLYSQVRDLLASQIANGELAPGSVMPNESLLAQRFGVSVGTIRRAVEGLEEIGVVTRRQGRGTFVAGLAHSAADRLHRMCGPAGETLRVSRKTLRMEKRAGQAEELLLFGLAAAGDVLEVVASVTSGKAEVGLERSVLPSRSSPDIEAALSQGRDVYAALAQGGIFVTRAEDRVGATVAEPEDALALSITQGSPLLQIERRVFEVRGQMVMFSRGRYLSGATLYAASSSSAAA